MNGHCPRADTIPELPGVLQNFIASCLPCQQICLEGPKSDRSWFLATCLWILGSKYCLHLCIYFPLFSKCSGRNRRTRNTSTCTFSCWVCICNRTMTLYESDSMEDKRRFLDLKCNEIRISKRCLHCPTKNTKQNPCSCKNMHLNPFILYTAFSI